ncbi:conserved hypothetical protein [Luteimonas sp. 9C]|nr:conserved hypothetical protein [Luteimonas sp. 9C]
MILLYSVSTFLLLIYCIGILPLSLLVYLHLDKSRSSRGA